VKVARPISHLRNGNGMFYVIFSSQIGYGVTWDRNRSPQQVSIIYSRSGMSFKVTLAQDLQGRAEDNNSNYGYNRINCKYKKRYGGSAHCSPQTKGGYTLVTLPRIVTPYCDSVDGTRDRVTYQKLITR